MGTFATEKKEGNTVAWMKVRKFKSLSDGRRDRDAVELRSVGLSVLTHLPTASHIGLRLSLAPKTFSKLCTEFSRSGLGRV